jgi:hypothetical protein
MLLADIITRSNFPLGANRCIKDSCLLLAPKAVTRSQGTLTERVAGDLKGTMWVSPDEKEVVRVDFASVSSLTLGVLGNVKGFQGSTEQQKLNGDLWLPSRQVYIANGRELVSGFRIKQVSEYGDYLKATTDVFQQVHSATASSE